MKPEKHTEEKNITLEKLLQLKRYEKPNGVFWERFDRELHGRMLRTLVSTPPRAHAWSTLLRLRWLQAGVAAACVAIAAIFAMDFQATSSGDKFVESSPRSADTVALAEKPAMEIVRDTLEPAIGNFDFGIGNVASAKPLVESTFSRDFGVNSVRIAAAIPMDSYSMDYASDSVFGGQMSRGNLVY